MENLECPLHATDSEKFQETLDCLRDLKAEEILEKSTKTAFTPTLDGEFLTRHPVKAIKK